MSKIIVENRSDLDDDFALRLVLRVMHTGRISNHDKQYCYLSVFMVDGIKYQVATDLNKKSDRFIILKEPIYDNSL
jgi:hypothetical protein